MRKIEAKMIAAIKSGAKFADGNTQLVHRTLESGVERTEVYLYGSLIGVVEFTAQPGREFRAMWLHDARPSTTTASRMRALLAAFAPRVRVMLAGGYLAPESLYVFLDGQTKATNLSLVDSLRVA